MVSRRNFLAVTVIMIIVFFLFQSLNMAKEYWNDYEENRYAQDTEKLPGKEQICTAKKSVYSHPKIVCIGTENTVAADWALYMKWNYQTYETLAEYASLRQSEKEAAPDILVLDGKKTEWSDTVINFLQSEVENGVNLLFDGLADVQTIKSNQMLRDFLGIESVVKDQTTVSGMHLYEGFLLGGETIYQAQTEEEEERDQDMELTFPWYHLGAGTKVYMKGIPEDDSVKTEEYPVVIWRKSFGSAYVFAINGEYMEDATGLGILSGVVNESSSYSLYPVVNAQNLIVANYPGMAEENDEVLQNIYSHSMRGLFRDIIWPSIAAVYQQSNLGLSCMMAPQFDYLDDALPKQQDVAYYMKLINEQEGEMGLSGYSRSDITVKEKLESDQTFLKSEIPNYRFTSFYSGNLADEEVSQAINEPLLEEVRTIVKPFDGQSNLIGYQDDSVTTQTAVVDGYQHTYKDDLRVKSIETAMGYTGILLDLSRIVYPEDDTEVWEKLSERFAANTNTYWKAFQKFDATTVSESDSRIRSFLALDYTQEREGDTIFLETKGTGDTVWFILRTHNEIVKKIEGGTCEKLEEGAWLIQVEKNQAAITLEPDGERFYYD